MSSHLTKPYILIVDDVLINRRLLERALQGNHNIQMVGDGFSAIEKAKSENPPGLILLDIMMPDMDGYEVCRRLKADRKTCHIPIIFITAANEQKNETDGFKLGAVDYITKPFSPAVVQARVKTHLALKHYSDHLEQIVAERKLAEKAVKENEAYLKTIMATIQTGAVIVENDTRKIFDANNAFADKIAACEVQKIIGNKISEYVQPAELGSSSFSRSFQKFAVTDRVFQAVKNNTVYIRQVSNGLILKGRKYSIQSFSEVTEMMNLLKTQEVNINLAKEILYLVNGHISRYTRLSADKVLFADAISMPCHAEGGDHYFIRSLGGNESGEPKKTVISLKDQSGHEVSCILRSIITDLIHNTVLSQQSKVPLDKSISRLNKAICRAGLFNDDDFFTSVNIEIDHETLNLKYISAGHPPFLLISGTSVKILPEPDQPGVNLPIGFSEELPFSFGEYRLQVGDRLILYTDGLTEMPLKNGKQVISSRELKKTVEEIIRSDRTLTVSEIMRRLIETIANMSHEKIIPFSINTSADDITLLGLEIESRKNSIESILKPRSSEEISGQINRLHTQIAAEWHQHGFGEPQDSLHIILEEAILNAWKHGNEKNPEKAIIVRRRYGNDFHLEVIDEGPGFDTECVLDPTSQENLTQPCGRGIFLIRHYTDNVIFEQGGSRIIMTIENRPYPIKPQKVNHTVKLVEAL